MIARWLPEGGIYLFVPPSLCTRVSPGRGLWFVISLSPLSFISVFFLALALCRPYLSPIWDLGFATLGHVPIETFLFEMRPGPDISLGLHH